MTMPLWILLSLSCIHLLPPFVIHNTEPDNKCCSVSSTLTHDTNMVDWQLSCYTFTLSLSPTTKLCQIFKFLMGNYPQMLFFI